MRWVALVVLLTACGRVAFDPLSVDAQVSGAMTLTGPALTAVRRCTGPFTVALTDLAGTPQPALVAETIDLGGSGFGDFFNDAACTQKIQQLTAAPGEITLGFHFRTILAEQTMINATAPERARVAWPVSVRQIAAGDSHTCVAYEGKVACWGLGLEGQLGNGGIANAGAPVAVNLPNAVSVSAGGFNTCAIANGGAAYCWGDNSRGQLGNGATTGMAMVPGAVIGLSTNLVQITAGDRHTCAVTSAGAASCWGYNQEGECGTGTFSLNEPTPRSVVGLAGDAAAITAGYDHTCVVIDGAVYCWGHNDNAPMGSPLGYVTAANNVAMAAGPVTNLSTGALFVQVAGFHACAISTGGVPTCWGLNSTTFNLGTVAGDNYAAVMLAGVPDGVTDLSLGQSNNPGNCLVRDGGAYCWGQNNSGNIGDGSVTTPRDRPTAVTGLSTGVLGISTGEDHACALLDDGRIPCWGRGTEGQLGNGQLTSSPTPVFVNPLP